MKCQLLIADGDRQVILYPEDEDEKRILKCIVSKDFEINTEMTNAEIYLCQGGWYQAHNLRGISDFEDGKQLVITLTKKKPLE